MKDKFLRIEIESVNYTGSHCLHYSGRGGLDVSLCACPNCSNEMFPGWTISTEDPLVSKHIQWAPKKIVAYFCPYCAFYMEDYWIHFDESGAVFDIFGGERDGGGVLQDIDYPYYARKINLYEHEVGSGNASPPRHQLGGFPFRDAGYLMHCPKCKGEMDFMGVLDYDDNNVPLYENDGHPVALIIGDNDCINIYSCAGCSVLGFHWAK